MSFRSKLLSTTALAVAGSMWLSPAFAAPAPCDTVSGATTTITCSGDNVVQINTDGDPTLVTLNPDATVTWSGGTVIRLEGDSDLILKAGSVVSGSASRYAVQMTNADNTVTLNDARIVLNDASNYGAALYAWSTEGNNSITLNGGSSIDIYGGAAPKYAGRTITGLSVNSEKFTVALNGGSSVNVHGNGRSGSNTYTGVRLNNMSPDGSAATRPSFTMNDASSIVVNNSGDNATATSLFGIRAFNFEDEKYAPDIVLNGGSTVLLNAYGAANQAIAISSQGVKTDVTLNGASAVHVTGYGLGSNGKYAGIYVAEHSETSDGVGTITLNGGSQASVYLSGGNNVRASGIISYGDNNYAANVVLNNSLVEVQTVGGSNGTYKGIYVYGSEASVTLNGESNVNVQTSGAYNATGIFVRGENNTITVNDDSGIAVGGDSEYAIGIDVRGEGTQVVLNGNAQVNAGDYYDTKYATGIMASNGNVSVTLNGDSQVRAVSLEGGHGNAGVVLSGGTDSSLTLNGNARISAYGYGSGADGVLISHSDHASVTLNGSSSISANGTGILVDNSSQYASINIGADAQIYARYGITNYGAFSDTVIAGTVIGSVNAIDMTGGSNNTLTLNSARIQGDIFANSSDHLNLEGAGVFNDQLVGFGLVTVNATGIWNLGTFSTTNVDEIEINSGKLAVNGELTADTITVNSGGTLGGSGYIYADVNLLAGGTLAPGNSPGTINVVGNVNFASGSIFAVEIDATAADLLNATGDVIIAPGTIIQPTFGKGADGFVGNVITAGGVVTGTFTAGSGAAVDYSLGGVVRLFAASPSSINGSIGAGSAATFGFLDTVLGQAEKSLGVSKNLWASVVSTNSDRTASGTSRGFSQKGNGGAFGGNLMQVGGFTLGLAGGYTDTKATTSGGGSRSTIDGYNAALYTTYEMGQTFFTAAVTGAYQDMDITRAVFDAGSLVQANGNTNAWLGGVGFGIGHAIPLNGGFTLTPKASLGWQHQTRKGYTEAGGGAGGFAIDDVSSDTIRGQVGAELGLKIQDPNAQWSVRPSIRAALAQEWREGDTSASGTFVSTGSGFTAALDTRDQTYLAVGAGVDVTVANGVTAFASYDGGFGGDAEKSGGIRVGARFAW